MTQTSDRPLCSIMRGIAIIGIVMHNFLYKIGFSDVNEFSFSTDVSMGFLSALRNDSLMQAFADIISFTGWAGVCLFVFLSGYGLERKYSTSEIRPFRFIWCQWLKLFGLMLAGVIAFVIIKWRGGEGLGYLFSLTMLGNTVKYELPTGVYWYFGLSFELYLLWLATRRMNVRQLLVVCLALLFVQAVALMVDERAMAYAKRNLFGWGHLFIVGMIAGRSGVLQRLHMDWRVAVLLSVTGFALTIALNFEMWCWLLILPFVVVVTVWAMADLVMRWSVSERIALWLGRLSAALFVVHPVVRELLLADRYDDMNRAVRFMLYLVCTVLLSLLFRYLHEKVTSLLSSCSCRNSSAR